MVTYHPIIYAVSTNTNILRYKSIQKIPIQIVVGLTLLFLMINLSWSLLIAKINTSICDQNMFINIQSYVCQSQPQTTNKSKDKQWPLGIFAAAISIIFILAITYFFTKDYMQFMSQIQQSSINSSNSQEFQNQKDDQQQHQMTEVKEEDQISQEAAKNLNLSPTKRGKKSQKNSKSKQQKKGLIPQTLSVSNFNSQADNYMTSQHMLQNQNDDIEASSRRSIRPMLNQHYEIMNKQQNNKFVDDFSKQNQNLFQINEAEDEEPFSPSKNNLSENYMQDNSYKIMDEGVARKSAIDNKISDQNILSENMNHNNLSKTQRLNDRPQSYQKDSDQNQKENNNKSKNQKFLEPIDQRNLSSAYSQVNLQQQSQLSNYQNQIRPRSHLKIANTGLINANSLKNIQTQGGLSDSTACIENKYYQMDLSSKNLLPNQFQNHDEHQEQDFNEMIEDIEDVDLEKQRSQKQIQHTSSQPSLPSQQNLNPSRSSVVSNNIAAQTPGRVCLSQSSKEESKDEDSSRIMMMGKQNISPADFNSNSRESLIMKGQNQEYSSKKEFIISLTVLILIFCGLILCCGHAVYSFYNMTTNGLSNALSIFGISVITDLIVLRPITITVLSLFTTILKIKQLQKQKCPTLKQNIEIDGEQMCLLGEIYEDYDAPMIMMLPPQQIIDDKQNLNQSEGQMQQIKVGYISQQRLQEINPMEHPDYQTNFDQERSPQQLHIQEIDQISVRAKQNSQILNYNLSIDLQRLQTRSLNEIINQKLIKANNKKAKNGRRSNLNEIVIVDSSYFYHQQQNIPLSQVKEQIIQQRFNEEMMMNAKSPEGAKVNQNNMRRKSGTAGEKVEISESFKFNVEEEEMRIRKAHLEKLKKGNLINNNYDIEEIRMASAKKQEIQESLYPYNDQHLQNFINISDKKSLLLPPIFQPQHQFETPKGPQNNRVQLKTNNQHDANISQQIITFNEMRDSKNDSQFFMKDLARGFSNSSKKQKALFIGGKDYNSLQRYLDDDKENQNSQNKNSTKTLGLRASLCGSSKRQKMYIDDPMSNVFSPQYQDPQTLQVYNNRDDELIKFTPQYSSLNKNKLVGLSEKFNSGKNEKFRQSMALPEMFSDFQPNQDGPDGEQSANLSLKKKRSRKSSASSKNNKVSLNLKSMLAFRNSIHSPSSIKENLEERMNKLNQNSIASNNRRSIIVNQQPDFSPFHANHLHHQPILEANDETYIEAPTMNMPSPSRDFNVMQSLDFNKPEFTQNQQNYHIASNIIEQNDQKENNKLPPIFRIDNRIDQSFNENEITQNDQNLFNDKLPPKFRDSVSSSLRQYLQPQMLQQKKIEKDKKKLRMTTNTDSSQNESNIQMVFTNNEENINNIQLESTQRNQQKLDQDNENSNNFKHKIKPKKKNLRKRAKLPIHDLDNERSQPVFNKLNQTEQNTQKINNSIQQNSIDVENQVVNKSIHEQILNDISRNIHNISNISGSQMRDQDDQDKFSYKSKMFEDSDTSTFRMIKMKSNGLGSRQRSIAGLMPQTEFQTNQTSHQGMTDDMSSQHSAIPPLPQTQSTAQGMINFYSNQTGTAEVGLPQKLSLTHFNSIHSDYKSLQNEIKRSKKVSGVDEVIMEENYLATHNSSPDKNPLGMLEAMQSPMLEKSIKKSLKKSVNNGQTKPQFTEGDEIQKRDESQEEQQEQLQFMVKRQNQHLKDYQQYHYQEQHDDEESEFNLANQMLRIKNVQQETQNSSLESCEDEYDEEDQDLSQAQESNYAQPLAYRKGRQQNVQKQNQNSKRSRLDSRDDPQLRHLNQNESKLEINKYQISDNESTTNDYVKQKLKAQEEARKLKEMQEILQIRIEDQQRKLKNFLKLAKQLKSVKDEKKIKEFLKYLKTEQKPLPYAKINELKSLEIMSSPYNQSLIDMIKDEYDQFRKGEKRAITNENKSKKQSKSQQRQDIKHGQIINKLSGIYGQSVGNTSQVSNTNRKEKDLKAKSRAESQQSETSRLKIASLQGQNLKLVTSSKQKMSRDSSNSTIILGDNSAQILQFKKREQRGKVKRDDKNNSKIDASRTRQNISGYQNLSNTMGTSQMIKIENFNTSDDESQPKQIQKLPFGLQNKNQILEIRESNDFNELQDFM